MDALQLYESAAVDVESPGFESLLSALQEVHTGRLPLEVLRRYHEVMSLENLAAEAAVEAITVPDDVLAFERQQAESQVALTLSVFAMVRALLERVQAYIDEPTEANMATTLEIYLQARQLMGTVHSWLDDYADAAAVEADGPEQA